MANNEWGTPPDIIDSSRTVMGSIDIDPASNAQAQKVVNSLIYFTKHNSGLDHDWLGNVWLNPPYGAGLAKPFAEKLKTSYQRNLKQAIVLTNGVHDCQWWNTTIGQICSAICLPDHRIAFINPDTGEPERGNDRNQMISYIGDNPDGFCSEFNQYGLCVKPQRRVITYEY